MPALNDRRMERLSDLFAQGTLNNPQEIAKLLKPELREKPHRLANINLYRERILEKLMPYFRAEH